MARPIVLSNGNLHVGINNFGLVHDFYYPYVGLENHSAGRDLRHHVGVWIDGEISWLDLHSQDWSLHFSYPHKGLIGRTTATNERLGVVLEFDDTVDASIDVFMRNIHIVNTREHAREIRVFTHQAFAIGDSRSNTDTAQYLPDSDAVMHYRGDRVFIVSGRYNEEPFDQHTVGIFGIEGKEGTFRDAEDGELSMSHVEHGRVDSVLRFRLELEAHESARVHYWIAAGTSLREALSHHKTVAKDGVSDRMQTTLHWWHKWLEPAEQVIDRLHERHHDDFRRSLMIMKSHIDSRGAVIASTDSAMLNYWRDAYAYCWPRDGAYNIWPLIRLGYTEEPRRFFEFCQKVLHPSGYLMHKFRADGALGSSWHPYVHDDMVVPPIQEDETALVLFVFAQFYGMHKDEALLKEFYTDMVKPMATFLSEYIDPTTNLPKPSYDLWEEVYLTSTYTTATVYAALLAAGDLADAMDDSDSAVAWRLAADDIYDAAHKFLYNKSRQSFYKGLIVKNTGEIVYDERIDSSSVFGAFMFGLFPVQETELQESLQSLLRAFPTQKGNYGLPRYENDHYLRVDESTPGNPWFISSLWLAQYCIEVGDTDKAYEIVDWVVSHTTSTGVLSEQIHPHTGEFLSVAPLSWSHAELIATLLDLITEPEKS